MKTRTMIIFCYAYKVVFVFPILMVLEIQLEHFLSIIHFYL